MYVQVWCHALDEPVGQPFHGLAPRTAESAVFWFQKTGVTRSWGPEYCVPAVGGRRPGRRHAAASTVATDEAGASASAVLCPLDREHPTTVARRSSKEN